MNLHEYQGKQLFAQYGLPVSTGYAVDTPEEAIAAAEKIGGDMWVVKAQVHAGGRGKAGGVKLVKTTAEVGEFAQKWLGQRLVTYQTDENGQPVSKILVESCTDIAEELYLGAVVDRSSRRIVFMRAPKAALKLKRSLKRLQKRFFAPPSILWSAHSHIKVATWHLSSVSKAIKSSNSLRSLWVSRKCSKRKTWPSSKSTL